MTKLLEAIHFATRQHRNQRRKNKDKTPYIEHPIEVMTLISRSGVTDEDILCAAVLHDTVEDTGATFEELSNLFGENVTNMVREVSDDKSLSKVERKKLQIVHAEVCSVGAGLIKLADKYSNLSSIINDPPHFWSPERCDGYFYWSLAVYRNLQGRSEYFDKLFKDLYLSSYYLSENELQDRLTQYYSILDNDD